MRYEHEVEKEIVTVKARERVLIMKYCLAYFPRFGNEWDLNGRQKEQVLFYVLTN
jgi:hypothetical protein